MPTHYDPLPDLAFGHHPDYGIVATNPKNLAASTWMWKGFDFHPVPNQPTLYALADQQRDGQGRTTRAIALLRKAGYHVDADAAFDPSPAYNTTPARDRPPRTGPDVAIAEHPRLGIVAATSDHSSAVGGRLILEEHGWQLDPNLDIYTLADTTDRAQALQKVARTTVSMHRSDLQVAVQPRFAQDVAARRPSASGPAIRQGHGQGFTTHQGPISAAAVAASPASAGLRGKLPVPAASAPAGPAGRPAHRLLSQPLTHRP